jgi:hypothetical protein
MKGYAPNWQVRCRKGGWTVDAAEAGFIRIGVPAGVIGFAGARNAAGSGGSFWSKNRAILSAKFNPDTPAAGVLKVSKIV